MCCYLALAASGSVGSAFQARLASFRSLSALFGLPLIGDKQELMVREG